MCSRGDARERSAPSMWNAMSLVRGSGDVLAVDASAEDKGGM